MSDNQISVDSQSPGNANLIYILYLIALVLGITGIVGVIMAYLGKDKAPDWLISHYNNQINIFWKFLLYMIVSVVLMMVVIGVVTALVALVWYIIRCVKGMQALSRQEAIANPGSWWL